MEELKQLRAKLLTIQQKPSGNKLSERNVVDIMQKLVEKYQLKLIFTMSGKEYLTPSRLVHDIKREVINEGRVSLLDLPGLLNVSVEQIENYATQVVCNDICLVNGQLMSNFYLDSLCEEINLNLQESGLVAIGELTVKYALPMSFLKEEIGKRVGTKILAGFSKENTLVTDAYLARHLGKVRGALRAAVKPLDLKVFDQSLVVSQAKALISSGQVRGVIEGIIFTPTVYQNAVWDEIKSYYFVNKYVEYDFIKKRLLHIGQNDYKKVCATLGEGENLSEGYVHSELIIEIKEKVKETMAQKAYTDFFDIELPSCISEEDLEGFIPEGIYCASHYLFTNKALDQAVALLTPLFSVFTEETKTKGKRNDTLSIDTIQSELKKKKFLNAPSDFLSAFSDSVYSKVSEKILEIRENRSKPSEIIPDTISSDFNYMYLCNKSLVAIQKKFANISPLQAFLCKGLGRDFFTSLLKIQLLHHKFQVSSVNFNDREKLISKLPDYLKEIFLMLSQKLSSKDFDGFVNGLLTNIKDIPVVSIRAVDKKTERNLLHKLKSELKSKGKQGLASQDFVEASMCGLKLKAVEQGILLEVPNEKWGISILLDICNTMVPHDLLFDFLRLAADQRENPSMGDMVSDLSSLLSLNYLA